MATMVYAGFWRRSVALMIDWTLLSFAVQLAALIIFIPIIAVVLIFFDPDKASNATPPAQPGVIHEYTPQANVTVIDSATPYDGARDAYNPAGEPTALPADALPMETQAPAASSYPAAPLAVPAPAPSDFNPQAKEDLSTPLIILIYAVSFIIWIVLGALYQGYFLARHWQATPGKRVMGCVVVTREGKRLTFKQAVWRFFACFLCWFPIPYLLSIGFFMIGWTREKTGLHDMLCGTRVVRTVEALPVIAIKTH
jgi:uncharacterized RDD family membrane protein YckC